MTATLVLYSARTELHMSINIENVSLTIRDAQKRICKAKLPQVSHSIQHAQKTHMSSEIDYKSCALFDTHKNAHVK